MAAYIEQLGQRLTKPSVKQQLAAIRMLFDWMVVGQVVATNPAAPLRGSKNKVRKAALLAQPDPAAPPGRGNLRTALGRARRTIRSSKAGRAAVLARVGNY